MVPNMCKYPTPWDGIGSAPFDTLVNATMVKRRSFSLLLLVEDAPVVKKTLTEPRIDDYWSINQ